MKFKNHNKKKHYRRSIYSEDFIKSQKEEMYKLMAKTDSTGADYISKAFDVTMNPYFY